MTTSKSYIVIGLDEAVAKLSHWAQRSSIVRASFNAGGHAILGGCAGSLDAVSAEHVRITWAVGSSPRGGSLILSLSEATSFEFSDLTGTTSPRFEDSSGQFTSCLAIIFPSAVCR